MYLRIETELYLKRLIVGGFDKVYEVGRIFRNEGMDTRHNPEFTTIELYQAYADYHQIMDLVEELYIYVTKKVCGTLKIPYQGKEIDMEGPWAPHDHGRGREKILRRGLLRLGNATSRPGRPAKPTTCMWKRTRCQGRSAWQNALTRFVEAKLIQPTFIYRLSRGDLPAGQAQDRTTRP